MSIISIKLRKRINLTKQMQDLYSENYLISLKKIKTLLSGNVGGEKAPGVRLVASDRTLAQQHWT